MLYLNADLPCSQRQKFNIFLLLLLKHNLFPVRKDLLVYLLADVGSVL